MKNKFFITILLSFLLLPLSSCSKYSSHYTAIGFVHTNTKKHASMSFSSFKGSFIFNLECENENEKINYTAKLENGNANVFYDCNDIKTELFSITSNNEINQIDGVLKKGKIYIIIEISEVSKDGKFIFDIK